MRPAIPPPEETAVRTTPSNRTSGLALVAAALILSACGGGAANKAGPTPPPTKAAYIARADSVCQSARTSLAQLTAPSKALFALGDTPKAFAQAATLFRRVQTLEQGELTRLQALRLPAGDVTMLTSYLQAGASAVALIGRLADAFAKGDKPTLRTLVQQGTQMAATTKGLAQGYGFKVCGHGQLGNGLT